MRTAWNVVVAVCLTLLCLTTSPAAAALAEYIHVAAPFAGLDIQHPAFQETTWVYPEQEQEDTFDWRTNEPETPLGYPVREVIEGDGTELLRTPVWRIETDNPSGYITAGALATFTAAFESPCRVGTSIGSYEWNPYLPEFPAIQVAQRGTPGRCRARFAIPDLVGQLAHEETTVLRVEMTPTLQGAGGSFARHEPIVALFDVHQAAPPAPEPEPPDERSWVQRNPKTAGVAILATAAAAYGLYRASARF